MIVVEGVQYETYGICKRVGDYKRNNNQQNPRSQISQISDNIRYDHVSIRRICALKLCRKVGTALSRNHHSAAFRRFDVVPNVGTTRFKITKVH